MSKSPLFKFGALLFFTGVIIAGVLLYDKYIAGPLKKGSELYFKTEEENKTPVKTAQEIKKENILAELRTLLASDTPVNPETPEDPVELAVKQSAWIPEWLYMAGFESLEIHKESINVIMPVWFNIDTEGNLVEKKPDDEKALRTFTSEEGIALLPSIACFDADLIKTILSDENRQKHINQIVEQVLANDYDGIDLDYESTYETDAERYEQFLAALSTELHSEGKILSVTVLSKWGDDVYYSSLQQTRKVQDWEMINEYADQIRIMTYDYTTASSNLPGPIAPYDWQIKVLDYAIEKIDPEKVWLGVNLYGVEWDSEGEAVTYKNSTHMSKIPPDAEFAYNQIIREGIATYKCKETLTCTSYYQTQQGVEDRRKLAKAYGIAGVAYWMLGDEGNLLDPIVQ
ncbi:MAG: glycosyl hydrolase family 18 protein [Candidatus Dojkabacteria bacterium]